MVEQVEFALHSSRVPPGSILRLGYCLCVCTCSLHVCVGLPQGFPSTSLRRTKHLRGLIQVILPESHQRSTGVFQAEYVLLISVLFLVVEHLVG